MLSFHRIGKSRLSLRLIFYIIIFSLLIALISAAIQTWIEYRQGRKVLEENLQLVKTSYLKQIAASNFNFDDDLLQIQLRGLLQLEDIIYTAVTESKDDPQSIRLFAGDPELRRDIEQTFPLIHKTQSGEMYNTGTLIVVANLDMLYDRIKERIAGILTENILRIFLISLFMFFLTQTIITRHLSHIAHYSDELDLEQLKDELTLERKDGVLYRPDEFDQLVTAINNMRVRLLEGMIDLKKSRDELHTSLKETVASLSFTAEKRDPYTAGHQQRVSELACAIAKELGLTEYQIEGLHIAALLHDIGKISLPAEFLAKPTMLSRVEKALIDCHPEVGYEILMNIHFPWPIAQIVYQHHEHLDGSGYPQGLKDKDILLEAKILTVADVVEAMSSHRPYRPSLGIKKAQDEILVGRGIRYHAESVDACLHLIETKQLDFLS